MDGYRATLGWAARFRTECHRGASLVMKSDQTTSEKY